MVSIYKTEELLDGLTWEELKNYFYTIKQKYTHPENFEEECPFVYSPFVTITFNDSTGLFCIRVSDGYMSTIARSLSVYKDPRYRKQATGQINWGAVELQLLTQGVKEEVAYRIVDECDLEQALSLLS